MWIVVWSFVQASALTMGVYSPPDGPFLNRLECEQAAVDIKNRRLSDGASAGITRCYWVGMAVKSEHGN